MTESDRGSTAGSGAQLEQAYQLGMECGPDGGPIAGIDADTTEEELLQQASEAVSHFTESAHYANHVGPELRRLAGYEDSGMGTYQVQPDREHADRFSTLFEYFQQGFTDAYYSSWEAAQDSSEGGDA
jgi:hypothetical protein